jgi:hypothetical protein
MNALVAAALIPASLCSLYASTSPTHPIAHVSRNSEREVRVDDKSLPSSGQDIVSRARLRLDPGSSVDVILFAPMQQASARLSVLSYITRLTTVSAAPPAITAQTCREKTSSAAPGRYTFEGRGSSAEVVIDAQGLTFTQNTCTDFNADAYVPSRGVTALLLAADRSERDHITSILASARRAEIAGQFTTAIAEYRKLDDGQHSSTWVSRRIAALRRLGSSAADLKPPPRALVIGISRYRWLENAHWLPSARYDANLFYQFLTSARGGLSKSRYGATLLLDEEATASNIRRQLRGIADEIIPGQIVYIYFSGHSMPLLRQGAALVAYDTRPDVEATGLPFSEVAESLADIQALGGHVLLFADTCHAGILEHPNPSTGRIAALASQFAGLLSSTGVEVSSEWKSAPGHPHPHGRFTLALVSALAAPCAEGHCATLTLDQVGVAVRKQLAPVQTPLAFGALKNFAVDANLLGQTDDSKFPAAQGPLPSVADLLAEAKKLLEQPLPDDVAWHERAKDTASELEQVAQGTILRYLAGEEFPQNRKEFSDAAELFAASLRLFPGDKSLAVRNDFCLARALLFDGPEGVKGALQLLNQAIASEPLASYLYNARGIALLTSLSGVAPGDTAQIIADAIREFEKAILLDPFWAYPRHNRALALKALGNDSEALKAYKDAVRFARWYGLGSAYLYHNLGALFARETDWSSAREAFQAAADLFQKQVDGFTARSQAAILEHNLPDAAWASERADYMESARAEAVNALGATFAVSGSSTRAIQEYSRALAIDPRCINAHHNLGVLLLKTARSEAEFQDCLRHFALNETLTQESLSPGRKLQASLDLGDFYLKRAESKTASDQSARQDLDKAEKYFNSALNWDSGNWAARKGLESVRLAGRKP